MRTVALSEVAQINPHWSPDAKPDDAVSFVGMANLNDEQGRVVAEEQRRVSEVRTGYTPFLTNDLLVAKITPCFENGKIGRATISETYGAGSTEFHVVRPGAELDGRYALHFLRRPHFRAAGELRMTGSGGQRRVPADYVAGTKIPLPPMEEQHRIADILDKADFLRAKRLEAIAHLNALSQSIFHEMFGADDYPRLRLDEIADVASGITKGRKVPADAELTELPYMAVSNVQDMSLNMNAVKTIAVTAGEIIRFSLQKDDLLMTEGGDPDKLGRGTSWTGELDPCLHQNHIYRVRLKPDAQVLPVYLNWATATGSAKDYFLRCAKQTTGIASINKTQLSATPIPVPPKELQQEFVGRVSAVERLKTTQRTQLAELDNLFLSLQDRAFKGEL